MNAVIRITVFAAAGWLAGEGIARTLRPAPPVAPVTTPKKSGRDERHNVWQEFLREHVPDGQASLPALTASEVTANLRALETLDGVLAVSERLHTAPAEEFPALLVAFAAIKDVRLRNQAVKVLFGAWAEKDVKAALAAVTTFPAVSMSALQGTLRTWAERDPRAVMDWIRADNAHGWAKMQAESTALSVLMGQHPEEAMALALEMGPHSDSANSAFRTWCSRDAAAADAWYATAPQEVRRKLFESWITMQKELAPEKKWQTVLSAAPDAASRNKALGTVLRSWVEPDAAAAVRALTNLPAGVWDRELASTAGAALEKSATGAGELAPRIPAEWQPAFWCGLTNSALEGRGDAAAAAKYFPNISTDAEDRMDFADRITKTWLKAGDPAAASAWVQALPRDIARDFAAAALAEGLYHSDPEAARTWAADIQSENIRRDVLKRLDQ